MMRFIAAPAMQKCFYVHKLMLDVDIRNMNKPRDANLAIELPEISGICIIQVLAMENPVVQPLFIWT
jgi:hypothetical protein